MTTKDKIITIVNMHDGEYFHDPANGYFRVDRYTSIGNPFILEKEVDRDKVCDQYETYFESMKNEPKQRAYLLRILNYLRRYGKIYLLCWCYPKRCHAETIKKWLLENV